MEKLSKPELSLDKRFVKEYRLKILANILFIIGTVVVIEGLIVTLGNLLIEIKHPEYGLVVAAIIGAIFIEMCFYTTYLATRIIAETSINIKQLKNNE